MHLESTYRKALCPQGREQIQAELDATELQLERMHPHLDDISAQLERLQSEASWRVCRVQGVGHVHRLRM